MRWIPDRSGRFPQRPYYEQEELDYICENIITAFLLERYGEIKYPICTNDLTILLEQHTSDLDMYADLVDVGYEVEGVTDFVPGRKPSVRISGALQASHLENRLRSTLTHELGHVKLHDALWLHNQMSLFEAEQQDHSPRCKRETIISAQQVDWLEWQAGYTSGAFLMPITALTQVVRSLFAQTSVIGPLHADSQLGQQLIQLVQNKFQVSSAAARVRLSQLRHLSDQPQTQFLNLI